jgi:hypothetical protein
VLRILSRLAVGIAVYVVIVVLATSFPLAAGMMLTFPALNGLAFFFSARDSVEPIARTMIWMPLVNGGLCALYILLFLWLVPALASTVVASCLSGLLIALWLLIVTRKRLAQGIAPEHQLIYSMVCTAAGVGLTVVAALLLGRPGHDPQIVSFSGGWPGAAFILNTIRHNEIKIALFGSCLLVFLLASNSPLIPDWVKGILAGLPIIPLGGLASISADSGLAVEERLQIMRTMAMGVWLSPAVPIWFVYWLSRFYSRRKSLRPATLDVSVRFLAVVLAWALCFIAVLAISFVIVSLW